MDLKDRVFAAADALALELGRIDLSVAAVRPRAEARPKSVGDLLKDWKRDRRATGAALPGPARQAVLELAELVFTLGVIAGREAGPALPPPPPPPPTPVKSGRKNIEGRPAPRLFEKYWQNAVRPDVAEAAARALQGKGYPLGHKGINDRLPKTLQIKPPRKIFRDIPAALEGSGLMYDGRGWWFGDAERPVRPKRSSYQPVRTFRASKLKQARRLFEEILKHLRQSGQTLSVPQMLEYMHRELRPPKKGKLGAKWLGHALRERFKKEAHLVKAGPKWRWVRRVSALRRRQLESNVTARW